MNELMKKDITIKVVSVFFAILLWLFVLNNIDNPFDKTYISIPVQVQNENSLAEKGLGLKNKNYIPSVEIEIRGRKDQLSTVTSRDIEATVDFSDIKDAGKKELQVELIKRREDIQIAEIKPKTMSVDIDRIVKKNFTVSIVPVGNPKEGYKIIRMATTPETVTIEGLESVINAAASIKTTVDVNNLGRSIVLRKECKVYNKNVEEMVGLNKNLEVEVNVEVAKEVPVAAVIKGKPASDFVETGHKVNVDKVLVTGLPEVLESVVELNTEPVNIDGINQNSEIKSTVRLPEGIKLVDASKEITVSVFVESLVTKSFVIKRDDITVLNMDENNFTYEIPESITVTMKGRQKDLNIIDPYSFKPTMDLAGLAEGTQKVPVKITMYNPEVRMMEEPKMDVKISKKQKVEE